MSLKTNTTSLQEILDIINNLPEAGSGSNNIQINAGTFTTNECKASINCGFVPDMVTIFKDDIHHGDDGYDYFSELTLRMLYNEKNGMLTSNGGLWDYSEVYEVFDVYAYDEENGFGVYIEAWTEDWEWSGDPFTFNYIAIKYTDAEDSEAVHLPTLANPGTSSDLAAGKQLIDANGNVVFGSKTSVSKTATTQLSSASTTITFTGLTAQPKMFSIVPTTNITLSSTRYVTGVTYDGTTTHGVYGYRQSSSATSYYSSSYFTWTYSNGTLTVKTNSSTNGGNFTNSVAYQLTYVVEDEVSVGGSSVQTKSGTFTTSNSATVVNCGFKPDVIEIYIGGYNSFTSNLTAAFTDNIDTKYLSVYGESGTGYNSGYCYLTRTNNGFEIYGLKFYTDAWDEWVSNGNSYTYTAIKYT